MKQNSSILFHSMRKSLKIRYRQASFAAVIASFLLLSATSFEAAEPEYLQSFNPAKGFKPAQTDLTEVFLQLAGSLEHHGSPVPYLRHVAAEHRRIESLYQARTGKAPRSFRPAYMTEDYVEKLSTNWNLLAPKLGLEAYAKDFGNTMRDAIKGTRGTGTIIVDIFNRHQAQVFDALAEKGAGADFEMLRSKLETELELNKTEVGEGGYEVARRDAVRCAIIIHGVTMKLFKRLDQGLKPADAERVKTVLTSIILDVGKMAHSELEAGISEWAFGKMSAAK